MVADTSKKKLVPDTCHRCGGLMVPEWTSDPLASSWRCVACGERVDPVILEHRRKNRAHEQAARVFVKVKNVSQN